MIRVILVQISENYDSEFLWTEVSLRFDKLEPAVQIDYNILEIFFEGLIQELDSLIRHMVPVRIDTEQYIFNKWFDNDTVLMERHDTVTRNDSVYAP